MPKPKQTTLKTKPKAGRGWLRIIGGAWRGRKVAVPETAELRPTNERAREAIFNRLMHAEGLLGVRLKGAACADLFAGTGALGLEALSRGAASVVFVERDGAACRALKQAVQSFEADDRSEILQSDATALPSIHRPFEIIFMDPPYQKNLIPSTLTDLSAKLWVKQGTLVVAETETEQSPELAAGYTLIDQRRYGRANIAYIVFQN